MNAQTQDDDEVEEDSRGHKSRTKSSSANSKPSGGGVRAGKETERAEKGEMKEEAPSSEQRDDFEDTELDSDVEYESKISSFLWF